MQKESKSYGAVHEVDAETMKAFDIATVRARMEVAKEVQSPAWEALCRLAGREIDFEVDDLIALEKRAIAEFKREKAEARERDERAARETKQERELREALVVEFGEDGWKL